MNMLYPCKITKNDDTYLVQILDFDEAFTEGETKEEALFNASEVLSLVLEQRIEDNEDIPLPSKAKAAAYITPHLKLACNLLLFFTQLKPIMLCRLLI